jgi:hypothetical protein
VGKDKKGGGVELMGLLTTRCRIYTIGDKFLKTIRGYWMRRSRAKRIVTIIILILTVTQFILLQPAFLGVNLYFGLIPVVFILPVSFICIVFYFLHVYQHWPLMLAWFKKSLDKKKQRDKTQRAIVLITFMLACTLALAFGWYEALKSIGEGQPPPLESMRIFFWVAFGLLAIHVWQRWKLTFSYFQRKPINKTQ